MNATMLMLTIATAFFSLEVDACSSTEVDACSSIEIATDALSLFQHSKQIHVSRRASSNATVDFDGKKTATSCASLFNRVNIHEYCYIVGNQADCDNSYFDTWDKKFRSCYWDTADSKCKGGDLLKCTPKRGQGLSPTSSADPCGDMNLLGPNHWYYGWSTMPHANYEACALQHDSGFVPQVLHKWNIPTKDIFSPADAIIGFNEPDGGLNALSPTEAANYWPQIEQRASELGITRIGSPVTTTVDSNFENEAAHWYDEFFAACTNCKVDFLTVHMYSMGINTAKETIKNLHARYNLPIWVKEFNKGGVWNERPLAEHIEYMRELVTFMENEPYIERYAWMSARNPIFPVTALINETTNELTDLGKLYRNLPMNVGM